MRPALNNTGSHMTGIVTAFMSQRIAVASALREGKCGGSIKDAILVLSSAMNAIASEIWPGDRLDRKRTIEVLVRYANNSPHPTTISVPLLHAGFRGDPATRLALQSVFLDYDEAQILLGADVDRSESDILSMFPAIDPKTLRQYSYADLYYGKLRSGIVHRYEATDSVELEPMTRRESAVSYWNDGSSRRIVFHFYWLVELLRSVAASIDPIFESVPLPRPNEWWIDGGH
jgi:hypothetical protein